MNDIWFTRVFTAIVILFGVIVGVIGALFGGQAADVLRLSGAPHRLVAVVGFIIGYWIGINVFGDRRSPEEIQEDEVQTRLGNMSPVHKNRRRIYMRAFLTFGGMLALLLVVVYVRKGCVFCVFD